MSGGPAGTGSGTSSVTLRATPAAPKEAETAGWKGGRDTPCMRYLEDDYNIHIHFFLPFFLSFFIDR
jgi:hypothetical protein